MKKLSPKHNRLKSSKHPANSKIQAEHDAIDERGADDAAVQEYLQTAANNRRQLADVMAALKAHRESVGMSLADLADGCGVNKGRLSVLENGRGNPTLDTVNKIAHALGVDITVQVSGSTRD